MVFSIRWLTLPIFIDSRPMLGTKKPSKCADRQISCYLIKMMKTGQRPRTLHFTTYPIESKVRSLSHSAMTCSRGIYCKVNSNRSILLRLLNFKHNKPYKKMGDFSIIFLSTQLKLFYLKWLCNTVIEIVFYGLVIN